MQFCVTRLHWCSLKTPANYSNVDRHRNWGMSPLLTRQKRKDIRSSGAKGAATVISSAIAVCYWGVTELILAFTLNTTTTRSAALSLLKQTLCISSSNWSQLGSKTMEFWIAKSSQLLASCRNYQVCARLVGGSVAERCSESCGEVNLNSRVTNTVPAGTSCPPPNSPTGPHESPLTGPSLQENNSFNCD